MLRTNQKLLNLDENEKKAIISYCANRVVAFLSKSDQTFYGSGVLVNIKGTVGILTAAHVINKIEEMSDCRILFSSPYTNGEKWAGVDKEYRAIVKRVSNNKNNRNWKPNEIDIGIIIPSPEILSDLPEFNTIDLRIDAEPTNYYTAETAIIIGFPERLQGNLRDYRGIIANPVYTQFVPVPKDSLENDIALGWDKIYSTRKKDIEYFPNAGGMSGGPVFSYIRESINGPWAAEKQLVFSGVLHYQHPEGCLLGHSRQFAKEFINDLLNKYNDEDLKKALSIGYHVDV